MTVRIRIGIHTGEPGLAETGYHGLDVVRAARISGSAHGGQILVSSSTGDLAAHALEEVTFRDLGEHRLKDLEQPQRILQVSPRPPGGVPAPADTADAARVMTIGGREEELAAAAEAALGAEERRLRLFRRSRVLVVAGAIVLAGAIAGAVLALTGGSSKPVLVEPNSVAVIDPKTDTVVGDIPVGSRPVAVAVGEGGVWVANADDGTVSRIDPKTRKVVKIIGVGGDVEDLAVGFGSLWVATGNDSTLARIDPRTNAIERTLFSAGSSLIPQPIWSVAVGAGAVWVTRGNRLLRIDPNTNSVTKTIPIEPPQGLAVGQGSVFVTTSIDHVLRYEADTGTRTATFSLPTAARAPVVGGGLLWVVVGVQGSGNVWGLNPDTGDPSVTTSGGDYPLDLAVSSSSLWSAGPGGAVRITNASRPHRIPMAHQPDAVAVGEGEVWVAVAPQSG